MNNNFIIPFIYVNSYLNKNFSFSQIWKTFIINVAKLSLKFSEFLRINAFQKNHQFREEILEILRFRGVSAILIFEKKERQNNISRIEFMPRKYYMRFTDTNDDEILLKFDYLIIIPLSNEFPHRKRVRLKLLTIRMFSEFESILIIQYFYIPTSL